MGFGVLFATKREGKPAAAEACLNVWQARGRCLPSPKLGKPLAAQEGCYHSRPETRWPSCRPAIVARPIYPLPRNTRYCPWFICCRPRNSYGNICATSIGRADFFCVAGGIDPSLGRSLKSPLVTVSAQRAYVARTIFFKCRFWQQKGLSVGVGLLFFRVYSIPAATKEFRDFPEIILRRVRGRGYAAGMKRKRTPAIATAIKAPVAIRPITFLPLILGD